MTESPPDFACGHPVTPANTHYRKNGSGNRYTACRICRNLTNKKSKTKVRGIIRDRESVRVKQPLEYLKLTPRQAKMSDAFNEAIDIAEARPLKCETPEIRVNDSGIEYAYYAHADIDEERPPSIAEAAKMCSGCPVLEMCEQYGRTMRAKGLVYGGSYFDMSGKIVGGEK